MAWRRAWDVLWGALLWNWALWGPAQYINMSYVPLKVLNISVLVLRLLFCTFLCKLELDTHSEQGTLARFFKFANLYKTLRSKVMA